MNFRYCPDCEKNTGHKRALGFGTFFMVIITGGLWLLILPFYPSRCIICGSQKIGFNKSPKTTKNNIENGRKDISAKYVRCPFCDKVIHRRAQRCRYCGRDVAQILKQITTLEDRESKTTNNYKKSQQLRPKETAFKVFFALILIAIPFLLIHAPFGLKFPSNNENSSKSNQKIKEQLSEKLAKRIIKEQYMKATETQNKLKYYLKESNPPQINEANRLLTKRLKEINLNVINQVVKSNTLNNLDEQKVLEPLRVERSTIRDQILMLKEAERIGK